MPRYALKIEYNGLPFCGWQKQPDVPSVQSCIEKALRVLEPNCVGIQGAGRTDTGVHATGQVAHVDMEKEWEPFRLSQALNFHMKPLPVAIVDVAHVPDDFHARFSAIERRYLFRMVQRRAPLTFDEGTVWRVNHPIDPVVMQEGANYLQGTHDFTTFRSTSCQGLTPIKTMDELRIETLEYSGGVEYRFHVRARSFLHNQVRSFVGTLERVGAGAWPPESVKQILESLDRTECWPVCPAHGLYLAEVTYREDPFA